MSRSAFIYNFSINNSKKRGTQPEFYSISFNRYTYYMTMETVFVTLYNFMPTYHSYVCTMKRTA